MEVGPLKSKILNDRFGISFSDDEYRKTFVRVMQYLDSKLKSNFALIPEEVILEWDDFVRVVEDGYNDCPPEYNNDLDLARNWIDKLYNSSELAAFREHKKFKEIIDRIDKKFISLTQEVPHLPTDLHWTHRRALKRAGREYADFISNHWEKRYGIKVEVIEFNN